MWKAVDVNGKVRRYWVELPLGFVKGVDKFPLLLTYHGGGGNVEAHRLQTGLDQLAKQRKCIVVHLEGTSAIGTDKLCTWNAGICCNNQADDVEFTRDVIDVLRYEYDTTYTFATGFSNGAMMCYRLAQEIELNGICAVASSMGQVTVPHKPTPIMHVHGLLDTNAPFYGGIGHNAVSRVRHLPVYEALAWWRCVNKCEMYPKKWDRAICQLEMWDGDKPIVLYKLPKGGHTWPGGVDVTKGLGTGALVEGFNTVQVMWAFFEEVTK